MSEGLAGPGWARGAARREGRAGLVAGVFAVLAAGCLVSGCLVSGTLGAYPSGEGGASQSGSTSAGEAGTTDATSTGEAGTTDATSTGAATSTGGAGATGSTSAGKATSTGGAGTTGSEFCPAGEPGLCASCLADHCCEAVPECEGAVGCPCMFECLTKGNPAPECVTQCGAGAEAMQFSVCTQKQCAPVCAQS